MDKGDCIIYSGSIFTIEWYYDKTGYSQAYGYFVETSQEQKRKFLVLIKKMGDFGKIYDKTKFTYEGDKIYAFKPQPDRYLSFFTKDKKIIVTNAFQKKTQKMPRTEKELAIKNMNTYNSRGGK
ncbi:MAG: type II toxin-antitoxin system RelE/ParE family toxin [Treponema sp.]|jgi:phage-related protein|nr:type II toxin-antitoxin system RelE/ParE family toxin [Treponema sp.]